VSVHLNPEQAVVVGEAIRAGLIESPDDVVNVGVETIRQRLGTKAATAIPSVTADAVPVHVRAKNLVELFADSPFKGADLQFERDKDTGRDIEL
jgi:Arc/MetJ-type ribon-helix-helix transcriptional regulator